ncbi:MAG: DUF4091 domain-containing protein [Clostridia bacterium]|nr:DUF4091 domain-containing protein [Clostridia bacterium]
MSKLLVANEAYKLTLNYGVAEPKAPTYLVAGKNDSAAFQLILSSENPYSVSIDTSEWFSSNAIPQYRRPHERLRVAVESPFATELHLEEFVKDDNGVEKADVLLNSSVRDSAPNVPSAVWVETHIPADASAGDYKIKVRVYSSLYAEDETLVSETELTLTVYDVVIPDYKSWSFYLDLWQHVSNVARHYDVPLFSDEHFAILEKVAKSLANLGQKSITVCVSEIPWSGQFCFDQIVHGGNMFEYSIVGITRSKDGKYHYDYSKMQRYIDICTEYGMSGDIEVFGLINLWINDALGKVKVDYVEPIRLRYFDESDGKLKYVSEKCVVEDYIKSLEKYFTETNQLTRVRIAADEPADMVKYRNSLETFRTIAPTFRFKTAINHAEFIDEFGDVIDDFVPYLYCVCQKYDILKDYQKYLTGKRFLWYVCCGEGRPNTQYGQHLIESRMIGPMNRYLGFDGFLRWSYCIWPEDPRHEARYSRFEAGDTQLVYPAYNGDVLLSLRYKNLRRGIIDHEILKMLDSEGQGELATNLVNSLILEHDHFKYYEKSYASLVGAHTHEWEDFNNMKKTALKALAES